MSTDTHLQLHVTRFDKADYHWLVYNLLFGEESPQQCAMVVSEVDEEVVVVEYEPGEAT